MIEDYVLKFNKVIVVLIMAMTLVMIFCALMIGASSIRTHLNYNDGMNDEYDSSPCVSMDNRTSCDSFGKPPALLLPWERG